MKITDKQARQIEKKLVKRYAKILGLRQKDIVVQYLGDGEFEFFVGHYGYFDFVMKDGSRKSSLTFSRDNCEVLKNVKTIKPAAA